MSRSRLAKAPAALLFGPLLGGMMLVSCSAAGDYSESSAPADAEAQVSKAAPDARVAEADGTTQNKQTDQNAGETAPRKQPQLIKTAEMVIQVEAVTDAIKSVSTVVREQQGDILGLQDRLPKDFSEQQTASMELRIPQAKLDATLDRLSQIGTVKSRSIQAQDVSNQLVDSQARLKNLRQSETQVLKILERTGSIADVLKVSQELSNIRASIEQIDAQLQQLKNQVAYSTVRLTLEDAIASPNRQPPLGETLGESWVHASRAVQGLTVSLMSLGIWLLAFSPYFVGLFLLGFAGKRLLFRRPAVAEPTPPAD
ncbi:MAG: DUF4349 domain-containing protein [Thermosynechococcaceae cyanobacterium]